MTSEIPKGRFVSKTQPIKPGANPPSNELFAAEAVAEPLEEGQVQLRLALLRRARAAYYSGAEPLLSDAEFDRLEEELRSWQPDHPYFEQVGAPVEGESTGNSGAVEKIAHTVPMLSMDKARQVGGVIAWFRRLEAKLRSRLALREDGTNPLDLLCVQPKIDGISASCYYRCGQLQYIASRGDGLQGQNISHIAAYCKDIPQQLDFGRLLEPGHRAEEPKQELPHFEVRGELYVAKQTNGRTDSPGAGRPLRNICAGLVHRKETGQGKKPEQYRQDMQQLRFVAYQCPQARLDSSEYRQLQQLQQLGFAAAAAKSCTIAELEDYAQHYLSQLRTAWAYETDGLIVCIDDSRLFAAIDSLWVVGHHHHYAIALKAPSQKGRTVLRNVRWQVGRQGRLTPVAEFFGLLLAGAMVERATLHNYDNVQRLQIQRGDILEVERSGDVIPYVLGNLGGTEAAYRQHRLDCLAPKPQADSPAAAQTTVPWYALAEDIRQQQGREILPQTCPSCGGALTLSLPKGIDLLCGNRDCAEQVIQRILFWVKRAEMDQIAEQSIRQLYQQGKLRGLQDLYALRKADFQDVPGYGDKKIANFLAQLQSSRQLNTGQLLERLGIPFLQQKSVQKLGQLRRKSRWENFLQLAAENAKQQPDLLLALQTAAKTVLPEFSPNNAQTNPNGTDFDGTELNQAELNQAELNQAELNQAELNQAELDEAELNQAEWPRQFAQQLLDQLAQQFGSKLPAVSPAAPPNPPPNSVPDLLQNTSQTDAADSVYERGLAQLHKLLQTKSGRNELWKEGFANWQHQLFKRRPGFLELASIEDLKALPHFREQGRYKVLNNLHNWLEENQLLLQELLPVLQIEAEREKSRPAGQVVCMTGSGPLPRKQLQQRLRAAGYQVSDNLSKATKILLCADPAANSSKLQKARNWGIAIYSYQEFLAEIDP